MGLKRWHKATERVTNDTKMAETVTAHYFLLNSWNYMFWNLDKGYVYQP